MPKSSTHKRDGSKSPAPWRGAAIEWPVPQMARAESDGFANGRAATMLVLRSARSNYVLTRCAAAYHLRGARRPTRDPGAPTPRPRRADGHELGGQTQMGSSGSL